MGGTEAFEQQLVAFGTTPQAFEELYKKNIVASKLFDKLSTDGTLEVNDEEIGEYIKSNYVKAAHILFSIMDTSTQQMYDEATIASKKQLAEDTLNKINAGEDFNKLMNELSEDPGLATSPDGYVFTKNEMVPEFEKAAFGLEENKVSELVETSYGYHIIKRLPLEVNEDLIAQYSANAKMAVQSEKLEKLTEEWKNDFDKIKLNERQIKSFK
jgi:parvulin-like peptidyl-prolyl isomerase